MITLYMIGMFSFAFFFPKQKWVLWIAIYFLMMWLASWVVDEVYPPAVGFEKRLETSAISAIPLTIGAFFLRPFWHKTKLPKLWDDLAFIIRLSSGMDKAIEAPEAAPTDPEAIEFRTNVGKRFTELPPAQKVRTVFEDFNTNGELLLASILRAREIAIVNGLLTIREEQTATFHDARNAPLGNMARVLPPIPIAEVENVELMSEAQFSGQSLPNKSLKNAKFARYEDRHPSAIRNGLGNLTRSPENAHVIFAFMNTGERHVLAKSWHYNEMVRAHKRVRTLLEAARSQEREPAKITKDEGYL